MPELDALQESSAKRDRYDAVAFALRHVRGHARIRRLVGTHRHRRHANRDEKSPEKKPAAFLHVPQIFFGVKHYAPKKPTRGA